MPAKLDPFKRIVNVQWHSPGTSSAGSSASSSSSSAGSSSEPDDFPVVIRSETRIDGDPDHLQVETIGYTPSDVGGGGPLGTLVSGSALSATVGFVSFTEAHDTGADVGSPATAAGLTVPGNYDAGGDDSTLVGLALYIDGVKALALTQADLDPGLDFMFVGHGGGQTTWQWGKGTGTPLPLLFPMDDGSEHTLSIGPA